LSASREAYRQVRTFLFLLVFLPLFGLAVRRVEAQSIPSLIVPDSAVVEGNSGTTNLIFRLMLSQATSDTVMVDYTTRDITAQAGTDYTPAFGVAVFPPGTTNIEVLVSIIGDRWNEADETFWLVLAHPVNARLSKNHAVGIIENDDPPPALSISDAVFLANGNGATNAVFNVNVSTPSDQTITVDYETVGGTATPGSEFIPIADTLTFVPGATKQTISVPLCGEALASPVGVFFVSLSDAMNATVTRSRAIATLLHTGPFRPVATSNIIKPIVNESGAPSVELASQAVAVPTNTPVPVVASVTPQNGRPVLVETNHSVAAQKIVSQARSAASVALGAVLGADLALELNVVTNFVHVEQELVLALKIANDGATTATDLFLTNRIPATASFLSAQATQGTVLHNKDLVIFNLGTITSASEVALGITLKLTAPGPATNIAQLSYLMADNILTNNQVSLVIVATNDLPTISAIPAQFTTENMPTPPIAIRLYDTETPAAEMILLGSSADTALVPDHNLIFGGVGADRTLTILPAANQTGTAAITLTAIDLDGGESSAKFNVTVVPAATELLAIERTEVVSPSLIEGMKRDGGRTKLYFNAEPGLPYAVEYCDTPSSGSWQTLTSIKPLPAESLVEISDETASTPQRFYRLKVPLPLPARILLSFSASAGKAYTIEYCDSLVSNSWHVLTEISPAEEKSTITIADPEPGESGRFYRVRSH